MRKVIVCTMWSPCLQELADIAIPNLQTYCDKHGYELRHINAKDNDCWFRKHEAFAEYFKELNEGDIIWYRDIDGLVMNLAKPVTDFIDDYYPFYVTKDFNEINGGSVIIKNTEAGRKLNEVVLEQKGFLSNEQNVYNSVPFIMFGIDFMKILPQNTINSYSYDLYPETKEYIGRNDLGDYLPGDLFIHFPGLGVREKIAMMNEFKEKIIE